MFANHVFENVPYDGFLRFPQFFGLLDGGAMSGGFELVIDERLEKLERHLLRQTALMQFQFGADDDDGTAGVVHALTEQVLAETALLAFERVGQRLERAIVCATQHTAAASVVEQRVDGFLQHALFVANDYVRSVQFHQLLQAVIAVDHAAIQIVQVGSGETSPIQRHQRAQLRRQHWNHIQNHPLRLVAALAKRFQHLQPLGELDPLLQAGVNLHLLAQFFRQLVHFYAAQQFLDRFRAHPVGEFSGIFLLQLAQLVFGNDVLLLQSQHFSGIDADKRLEVQDVLQVAHGDVQQVADAAGQTLEEPYVSEGRTQLNGH